MSQRAYRFVTTAIIMLLCTLSLAACGGADQEAIIPLDGQKVDGPESAQDLPVDNRTGTTDMVTPQQISQNVDRSLRFTPNDIPGLNKPEATRKIYQAYNLSERNQADMKADVTCPVNVSIPSGHKLTYTVAVKKRMVTGELITEKSHQHKGNYDFDYDVTCRVTGVRDTTNEN